jgi:hypothetical protein
MQTDGTGPSAKPFCRRASRNNAAGVKSDFEAARLLSKQVDFRFTSLAVDINITADHVAAKQQELSPPASSYVGFHVWLTCSSCSWLAVRSSPSASGPPSDGAPTLRP